MSISFTLTKRSLALAVLVILLSLSTALAYAQYTADLIYICIKNDQIKSIGDPANCKSDETAVGLVTEAALTALQNQNAALQQQLDDLDALIRRLHGGAAAVVENSLGGSFGPADPVTTVNYSLIFCSAATSGSGCVSSSADYVLESGPLTEEQGRGAILDFSAANTPDFAGLTALLTNGENDSIGLFLETDQGGGMGVLGTERNAFFLPGEHPAPVSADPDINDLSGFEIGKIRLVIDSLNLNYDPSTQTNRISTDIRVFYELAE